MLGGGGQSASFRPFIALDDPRGSHSLVPKSTRAQDAHSTQLPYGWDPLHHGLRSLVLLYFHFWFRFRKQ